MITPTRFFISQKAFIYNEGKILLLKEADDGVNVCVDKRCLPWWRIELGEKLEEAFERELEEEVGISTYEKKLITAGQFFPTVKGEGWHIVALYRLCKPNSTDIRLSTEHKDATWVTLEEAMKLERPGDEEAGFIAVKKYLEENTY